MARAPELGRHVLQARQDWSDLGQKNDAVVRESHVSGGATKQLGPERFFQQSNMSA
jgi:hypothetical protein